MALTYYCQHLVLTEGNPNIIMFTLLVVAVIAKIDTISIATTAATTVMLAAGRILITTTIDSFNVIVATVGILAFATSAVAPVAATASLVAVFESIFFGGLSTSAAHLSSK